ncbi:MAG: TonB-dependent receptor, partial [Bacteroidales bacterium]|nr:TonB-dependent receptor [Bacteroidales bacterium]
YWSADRFSFNQDTTFRYSNFNAALRWRHRFHGGMTMTSSVGADRFSNQLEDFPNYSEAYRLNTSINQAFARLKFEKPSESHTTSFGAEVIGYDLQGGHMTPFDGSSLVIEKELAPEKALQPSVYASDIWNISRKFSLDYGLRVSSFFSEGMDSPYIGPELRLSGKYSFNPNFSFKAGANSLRQYIHLVSNTTTISPMDTWKLCDENIRPVDGWQGAGGLYWTVFDGKVDLSLESYWKQMWNYLDYKSGASLVMNDHLADDLVRTKGKAYGIEFMARKSIGKLNGWMSYTYSRTFLKEMEYRGITTINQGNWYRASYDMPHDFKLVGNYAFTARYSISANLDYSTGRPVTVPTGYYYYGGGYRLAFSERNCYRIPDYFRLDLAFNVDPGHYLKQFTHMSLTVGCYNVTGRKNVYSVFYTTDEGRNLKGYKVSVFASQIPYLNLNILF